MTGLSFGAPFILAGLVVLPLIWWLLRYAPPRPRTELFPPLRLLLRIVRREETPDRSPWWLTLLRLAMAAAIIVALAEPVLDEPGGDTAPGAIAIVMDNGWASAPDWDARTRRAAGLIAAAGERDEPVVLAFTAAAPNEDAGPFDAAEAARRLAAARPVSAFVDRLAAAGRVAAATGGNSPGTLVLLTDGLATPRDQEAWARLVALRPERILLATERLGPLVAMSAADNGAEAYEATLIRPAGQPGATVPVLAFDDKGRRLGETVARFGEGATEASARFVAPFEIRNDFASIRVDGTGNAASTRVFDESQKRRRIGLLSAADADQDQPLLSPLHYIRGALSPFADLAEPGNADLSAALPALLERKPAMIVMADVGVLGESEREKLIAFVEKGGTLVRFAGPRLAAAPADDKLLPVRLRQGDRTLGGALSWTEPQRLAEFPTAGPFAGLSPPREVTVSRQVMAEPGPDLAARTWANLGDGTPLVTGDRRGAGHVVLFHVTPEATWSNLPISGSFVDMLRRLVRMSRNQGSVGASADGTASLPPWRAIAPDGSLAAPPADAQPLLVGAGTPGVTLANPPGLYGGAEGVVALNLLDAGATLDAIAPLSAAAVPVTPIALAAGEAIRLKPALLAGALGLGVLDSIAALALGGALVLRRRAPVAALLLAAMLVAHPRAPLAQEVTAETAIEAISSTRLAYVLTGDPGLDSVSRAGLAGLTRFLIEKTALEPGEPAGVDLETDELAFFPIIYWPVSADAEMPSQKAIARLDAYMRQGGTVLFDTRDQLEESWQLDGAATAATGRLRDILAGLNIPPLEAVPADHVLTKSFYLLETFPGLYADGALWVEAGTAGEERADRPVRAGDGVSPILITSNDFAAAWAEDENGEPLFPIASGDPDQREYALRAGVNIAMYMLTGNYKSDQVHVPALLERLGQ